MVPSLLVTRCIATSSKDATSNKVRYLQCIATSSRDATSSMVPSLLATRCIATSSKAHATSNKVPYYQ